MKEVEIQLVASFTVTPNEMNALRRSGMTSIGALQQHLRNTVEIEIGLLVERGTKGLKADALIARGELEVGRAMIDNTGTRRTFKLLKGRSR